MTCICYEIMPCQFPCEYYSFRGLHCVASIDQDAQGKFKELQGEKSKYREICRQVEVMSTSANICRRILLAVLDEKTTRTYELRLISFGGIRQAGERPRRFVRIRQKAIPCCNNKTFMRKYINSVMGHHAGLAFPHQRTKL